MGKGLGQLSSPLFVEGTDLVQVDHGEDCMAVTMAQVLQFILANGGGGSPGPMGPQGIAGPPGNDGAQGLQGLKGDSGNAGAAGAAGSAGAPGLQGLQGPQGLPGADGAQGASGAQGIQGIQGIQGPAGAAGAQGPSGSDQWVYVKLASDFSTSSATAVDIPGLSLTPAPNVSYEISARLLTRTATATVGPRPGVAWPAGMTDGVASIVQESAAGTQVIQMGNVNASVLAPVGGLPTATQSYPANVDAYLISGASPSGSFKIQLASETAGTNVTTKAGSFLKYRALP